MKKTITYISNILLLFCAAQLHAAANSALTNSDTAKQFFKSGNKLRAKKPFDCNNQEYINCLTLGDIQIGSKFDLLRQKLGEPWHTFPRNDGSIDEVYPLRIYQHSTVYWVISHKNNRIVAVQLTGNRAPKTILFAGLQLGDHQDLVLDTLGYPEGRRRYGRNNAYLWDYHPLPVTLEIYNRRLYSVRIHQGNNQVTTEKLNHQLLARLIGQDKTPVNRHKNIDINQVTKQQPTSDNEFENVITKVKSTATSISEDANQIGEKIQQTTAQLSEQVTQTTNELGHKVKQRSDQLINQAKQQGSEKAKQWISDNSRQTAKQITDTTKQTIENAKNSVQNALNTQFKPIENQIIEAVEQWTEAWSQKDIPGYFSAYTKDYIPPSSASRKIWQDKQEQRIQNHTWIKLATSGYNFPPTQIPNDNKITVRFWLQYEVSGYKDKTLKSLTLIKLGNRWLISKEQSLLVNKL